MRSPLLAAVLLAAAVLAGCAGDDARRKAIADSAATSYEAAAAIEAGVPVAGPCAVIKANASATAAAVGYQYPPKPAPAGAP